MISHIYSQAYQVGLEDTSLTKERGPQVSPSHTRAHTFTPVAPTLHSVTHTSGPCGCTAPSPPAHAQSIPPGAHPGQHTCREYTARLALALALALTPPRFPSRLVFLETLLSVPLPPRPEVFTVFLASLVSAPSPLLPAQDLPHPQCPGGTPAIPFSTVIPEGIPGCHSGHGFSRWLRGEWGGTQPLTSSWTGTPEGRTRLEGGWELTAKLEGRGAGVSDT